MNGIVITINNSHYPSAICRAVSVKRLAPELSIPVFNNVLATVGFLQHSDSCTLIPYPIDYLFTLFRLAHASDIQRQNLNFSINHCKYVVIKRLVYLTVYNDK